MFGGGYLTFVNSDDYLSTEAFCCWMKHSYADLVVGGYLSFGFRTDKSETYLENLFAVDEQIGKCLTDKIMNLSFRTPWGKLFRAEIVINNNLRFNEQMKLAEDTLFMLGYYQYCTKIATNALVAYHYYIGGGNDHKYALKADSYVLSLQAFDNAYRNISKRLKVDFSALNYFLSSYFATSISLIMFLIILSHLEVTKHLKKPLVWCKVIFLQEEECMDSV